MSKQNPNDKENSLQEDFQNWLELVKSGALVELAKIFKKHLEFCKHKVCGDVEVRNFDEAYKWQAKANNTKNLLKLINDRLSNLESRLKNGG